MGDSRSTFFTKETAEMANSIFWFVMDACWMFGLNALSMSLAIPTVLTGLLLVRLEKRRDARLVDIAMLFWILMNVGWLSSEILAMPEILALSKASFFLGVFFIVWSLRITENWKQTVSYFKRLRISEIHKAN